MVAFDCQPLFAVAYESFVVHLNLTPTKRPDHADMRVSASIDLVMLKVRHETIHTTIKTAMPTPAPKKTPAIRPHNRAFTIAYSFVCVIVLDQHGVSGGQLRQLAFVFQTSESIRQRSESVADGVVLVGSGHGRHTVREFEDNAFKGHVFLLRGQRWSGYDRDEVQGF
jgi:hypothetical protein